MTGAEALDQQIRFAIAHKRLVAVSYRGRLRVAEPHDYGLKNGSAKLFIYQIREEGGGQPKKAQPWRMLDVSKIEACIVSDATFPGSRGDASQRHHTWDELYARVE